MEADKEYYSEVNRPLMNCHLGDIQTNSQEAYAKKTDWVNILRDLGHVCWQWMNPNACQKFGIRWNQKWHLFVWYCLVSNMNFIFEEEI